MLVGLGVLVFPGVPSEAAGPTLVATPSIVTNGSWVEVQGFGFSARQPVQLALDGTTANMPAARASRQGSFRTKFRIAGLAAGSHAIGALVAPSAQTGARSLLAGALTPVASTTVSVVEGSTSAPATPLPATPIPATPVPVTPAPATPVAATPVPVTPVPVTPAPATPAPATPVPATPAPATPVPATPAPAGRVLTFAAEFDGGLGAFAYDGQWGCGFGRQSDFMGNLQQVSVAGGVATITAQRKATPCGRQWASAVMSTRGRFAQQYGYFEARIRYDAGNGLWPAFWMNPADGGWPPEIDIMEAYPNLTAWPGVTRTYATLHYSAQNLSHEVITDAGVSLAGGWHRYGMEWQAGSLAFYLDGVRVGSITQDVPAEPFYIILNLAVGNWSAMADGSTPDGAQMQIDYVRVYR